MIEAHSTMAFTAVHEFLSAEKASLIWQAKPERHKHKMYL
jgi:hypothetical protein